jgi:hypothetical protein
MLEILRRHGPEAADGMDQSADVVDEANEPARTRPRRIDSTSPDARPTAWRKTDAVVNGTIVDDSEIPEFLKGDASVKAAKAASVKAMADEVLAKASIDIEDLHASDHPIAKANKASWDQVIEGRQGES